LKFERTDSFRADYKRLTGQEQELFRDAVKEFNLACEAYIAHQQPFPGRLRVKPVQDADGVFEMTWSFSGPDGRATFEWLQIEVRDGKKTRREPAVRWRRLGDHKILRNP
jgi:hypothetical protein